MVEGVQMNQWKLKCNVSEPMGFQKVRQWLEEFIALIAVYILVWLYCFNKYPQI